VETGCDAFSNDRMSIDMHNMVMGLEFYLVRLSGNPSWLDFIRFMVQSVDNDLCVFVWLWYGGLWCSTNICVGGIV
jgi:hypothetical protein